MKITRRIGIFFFLLIFAFLFSGVLASADTGPKPSVRITVGDLLSGAYATLLSERSSTGPHSAWDGTEEHAYYLENERGGVPKAVWDALVSYEDTDGFYYLQGTERKIDDGGEYIWGYYPPERFKLLLYFPESETFLVSEIYERYAFHSYFAAFEADGGGLYMFRTYDYTSEMIGFFARLCITLTIELLLALLFFRGERRMIGLIAALNFVTQILLNLSLAKTGYLNGAQVLMRRYVSLECLVFLIEGAVLCLFAPRLSRAKRPRLSAWGYALAANLCSLLLGLWVSRLLPSLF